MRQRLHIKAIRRDWSEERFLLSQFQRVYSSSRRRKFGGRSSGSSHGEDEEKQRAASGPNKTLKACSWLLISATQAVYPKPASPAIDEMSKHTSLCSTFNIQVITRRDQERLTLPTMTKEFTVE